MTATEPHPLPESWYRRELLVLREFARQFDDTLVTVTTSDLASALNMDVRDVEKAGVALTARGFVETTHSQTHQIAAFTKLTGTGYVRTGLHPTDDDAARLIDALRKAADQTSDPDDKRRLRTAADSLSAIASDVVGGVITAVLTAGVSG